MHRRVRASYDSKHIPSPFPLTSTQVWCQSNEAVYLAYAKTWLYALPTDLITQIMRHVPPPASVRRHMDMVVAEFRGVLKDVARVVHDTSTERTRICTVAGRILYRTRRLPWQRELFSYAQSIRRLNKELESTRMRAAERWEVLAAKERLSQRLDERLNKLYGTC